MCFYRYILPLVHLFRRDKIDSFYILPFRTLKVQYMESVKVVFLVESQFSSISLSMKVCPPLTGICLYYTIVLGVSFYTKVNVVPVRVGKGVREGFILEPLP